MSVIKNYACILVIDGKGFFVSFSIAPISHTSQLLLKYVKHILSHSEAIYYLLEACFVTGIILDVDGGHHIRQYANKRSDPMRKF